MTVPRSPFRRAVVAALVLALGASGAVAVTSAAQAAPTAPILLSGFPAATTTGDLIVSVIAQPDLPQDIDVWYLEPGVTDPAERIPFCGFSVSTAPFSGNCVGSLPDGALGEYRLFATADANDGTGESPASATLAVKYGTAAASTTLVVDAPLNSGGQLTLAEPEVTVTGSGAPALGRVEVRGTSVDPLVSGALLCAVDPVPVSGEFACTASLPSPTYGQWSIAVTGRDVSLLGFSATPSGAPYSVVTAPPFPTVAATAESAAVTFQVQGLPGSNAAGELLLNGFGVPASAGFCPATWDGNPVTPPTAGASIPCAFTSVPAGVHIFESGQFLNGTATLGREDAVFVPETPTLTVAPFPGGATISGTVDTSTDLLSATGTQIDGLQVEVQVGGVAGQVACFAAVDLATGAWSCDAPLEPGPDSFAAIAASFGFADDPAGIGVVDGYVDGASAPSAPVAATIPAGIGPFAGPTMSYSFGPASIRADAVGLPNAGVGVELYSITEPDGPGGGYQYDQPVSSCGFIPGEGDDGVAVTAPSVISDCVFDGLAPGIWNVYSSQRSYFEQSDYVDDYIRIPSAPTLAASRNDADQIVASGQGTPGFRVLVRQLGGSGACDAVVGTNGAWSCVVPGITGDALLRAQQQSQGFVADPNGESPFSSFDGYSAFTPTAFVAAVPPAQPVVSPQPLPWVLEGYNGEPLFPGQALALSAQGLPVGTEIVIEIRSTPQVLGSSLADDLGRFALEVTVPLDIEPGDHTLVGLATPPGGVVSPIEIPVVVVAAPVDDAGAEQPAPVAEGSSGGSGDRDVAIDRADPAAPSAISDSIPTIDRIFRTPLIAVTASGLALAILLLVALPAELLNSTVASNSRRLGRWYAAIDDRIQRATEWFAAITRTRALAAALLVVATAVIFGFVDPDYGFDPVSLRMTISLAIGLFVVTYVSAWISGAIIQRVWSIPTRVGLQPAALLFAVVGVIVARLLEFSPGFLIGLVIGLDLLTRVDAKYRVRATLTSLGVTVGLALLGWVGFSILSAVSTGEPTVAELLLSDALVATAAEGMTAALASLLPLGFLQGHEIFRRSKGLWAGTFLVVATLFALIVLPTASETEGEVADVGFWMLVMVIFAVVTLTLWAVLQFTGRHDADADEVVEQPAGAAR